MAYKSARSKATDISTKVRKQIHERDKCCRNCGSHYNLSIAHVFLSRAQGGLGCVENLVLMCYNCHMTMDQGRVKDSAEIRLNMKSYLNRLYPNIDISNLKYKY